MAGPLSACLFFLLANFQLLKKEHPIFNFPIFLTFSTFDRVKVDPFWLMPAHLFDLFVCPTRLKYLVSQHIQNMADLLSGFNLGIGRCPLAIVKGLDLELEDLESSADAISSLRYSFLF